MIGFQGESPLAHSSSSSLALQRQAIFLHYSIHLYVVHTERVIPKVRDIEDEICDILEARRRCRGRARRRVVNRDRQNQQEGDYLVFAVWSRSLVCQYFKQYTQ